MPSLQLELSGKNGLVPSFAGDLNDTSASPNRRYLGVEGQTADGIYDPLRLDGYLSPANNTFADLTGTITDEFIARAYASSTDLLYLAQAGTRLSTVDGLDGTVITSTALLAGTSVFKDLEMYEINGEEALFYTYKYLDTTQSTIPNIMLGWQTVNTARGAFQISSDVYEDLGLSTTQSVPMTADGSQKLSQSFTTEDFFTVTAYPVSGIRVALNMPFIGTTQNWTLRIGIQTDSGGSPSGSYVSGGYVDINPTTLPTGGYGYVYATFAAPLSLTADTVYHIVVEPTVFAELGANEGLYWIASAGNNSRYSTGTAKRYDGASWTGISFYDESFDFSLVVNSYTLVGESIGERTVSAGTITTGATQNAYTAGATTLSMDMTVTSAIDPIVVVGVSIEGSTDDLTSITCGGAAMTLGGKGVISSQTYLYLYYLTGVTPGTNTITVNVSGSQRITMMGVVYYGIDQTTPFGTLPAYVNSGGSNITTWDWNTGFSPTRIVMPIAFAGTNGINGSTSVSGTVDTEERSFSATDPLVKLFDSGDPIFGSSSFGFDLSTNGSGARFARIDGVLYGSASTTSNEIVPGIREASDESVFLVKADNGFLYWFTNNRVHKFAGGAGDPATGTLATDVLSFPAFLTCVDAVDTNSLMYVAVQSSEVSASDNRTFDSDVMGVYVWDRVSTAASMRDFVPIYGARSIKKIFVNADGELRVITIGEDRFTEIRGVVNGRLSVLKRLGINAYPVRRDAVDVLNNMVTWLGADGIIYALGSTANRGPEQLYKLGTINSEVSGTLTSGILYAGNESSGASLQGVFLSWKDNAKTLSKWYPHGTGTINTVAQKGNQGNVYSLVKYLPMMSNIKNIDIVCLPNGTDGDTTQVATIKFYANQSTTPWASKPVTRHDIRKGYISYELNKQYVTALQVEIEWEATQTLGANDFNPSYAIVEYEGTRTR